MFKASMKRHRAICRRKRKEWMARRDAEIVQLVESNKQHIWLHLNKLLGSNTQQECKVSHETLTEYYSSAFSGELPSDRKVQPPREPHLPTEIIYG